MTKQEFEKALGARLEKAGLAAGEVKRSLDFYLEMIDDRMEDGMSEADAVAALGDLDAIAREIMLDAPLGVLVKNKITPKRALSAGETALLVMLAILGFPIWFSLLIGIFCIVIGIYVTILSLIIAAVCVVISLIAGGIGLLVGGLALLPFAPAGGLALLGAAFLIGGIAILFCFPAKYIILGLWKLTALCMRGLKSLFVGKTKKTEVEA